MFKLKTLRRLTRFAMCFYVFSYCMSFTVCAEEYPFHDASVNEIGYYADEDSTYEAAANVTETETNATEVTKDVTVAETENLGAGSSESDIPTGYDVYNGSSFSGLHNQIWDNVRGTNATADSDKSYSVLLTNDIQLDNGNISWYANRIGDVTIDADGRSFIGAGEGFTDGNKRTNLNDLHAFRILTIKNARFTGFKAGVFVHNWVDLGWRYNQLILENCTFEGNEGGNGAVLYAIQEDYITLINCSFINNKAGGSGGVIYLTYPGSFTATGCRFINNTAEDNGGVIAVVNESREVQISDCTFINNTAGGNGGAVYVADESSDVQISGSYFANNKAAKGGAVYDEVKAGSGNSYHATGCEFMSNVATAANGGGAIYRENTAADYDRIMDGVFLGNTDPQIVLANVDNRTNIEDVIYGNWYGGTVDDAMAGGNAGRPSISIEGNGTTGVYNWKLLNLLREGTYNVPYITFAAYSASYGYSNGSVEYESPYSRYYGEGGSIPLGIKGENITFEKDAIDFAGDGYRHGVNATIKPGARTYSVTLSDPFGNELITRSYDRDIDEWGVEVNRISKTNGTSSLWGPAIEGDTLSCRFWTNIYVTSDNGTLIRYVDEENGYVYGTATTSSVLFNETFGVYVDEEFIGNYTTDENGFFNLTTNDLGKTGYVSLMFDNDMYSKRYETSLRIIKDGETSVNSYPAGDNAVEVHLSSESGKALNEGNLSLYYTTQTNSTRTLLDSWDMSTEGEANKTSFSITKTDLNGTLPAGYYFFTAEYICESGNLKNATEGSYSDSKGGTLVGSEGYTAVDLMTGSSKNTLEVYMTSIGNTTENCTVSLYYRPVSGGKDTLLESWNMGNQSEYYRSSFWGDVNVSALPDGDYVFTVNFNCTDGTFDNSSVSKTFTVPVVPDYDADVSIPFGANKTVKLGSADFNLNAVAANPGSDGKWIYKSSNTSVATISDEGLVHPVSVGQTNITAIYKASPYKSGSAVLLLTVTEASSGNDTTPGNETTPENETTPGNNTTPGNGSTSGNDAPVNGSTSGNDAPTNGSTSGNDAPSNETVPENTTDVNMIEVAPIVLPEQNVSVAMAYTDSVTFTGNKFKSKDVVAEGNGTYSIANVTVKINTTIMSFAQPVFKFKNIKHSTARSGKKSSVTVTFKAVKGATKAQKKQVKALNKVLKKQKMEFTLEQVDISKATDATYTANKKMTRVSKAVLTVDGITYKLKNKSDYSAVITNSTISLTGNGDYNNTYVIPLNNG